MTKDIDTPPVELTNEKLDRVRGGFVRNIGTTENVKSRQPKGVLIGQQGNDFLLGGSGNDT